MNRITIEKSMHLEAEDNLHDVYPRFIAYVSRDENILMDGTRIGGGRNCYYLYKGKADPEPVTQIIRRSEDNGRTWRKCEDFPTEEPLDETRRHHVDMPAMFLDPEKGSVLRFYPTSEEIVGVLPWDKRSPHMQTRRIFTQVSRDEGTSWTEPEQLVVKGDEFDSTHWARGLWYGKNGACAGEGFDSLKLPDGGILIPCDFVRLFENGTCYSDEGSWGMDVACFIGLWRDGGNRIEWEQGEMVPLPERIARHGINEPSAALLPDGRIFLTVRVSEHELATVRYHTISSDNGRTWQEAKPLQYTTGEFVPSPASMAKVIMSGRNGKLYYVGNIINKPGGGAGTRAVLQIAEIDLETLRLIPKTVTVIDERQPGQPEIIGFSNWCWYEDRETGDIVMLMAPSGDPHRHPTEETNVPKHAYRYRIVVPERESQ